MLPFFFDPTMVILIPALVLAFWAQSRVKSTFAKYSKVSSRKDISGSDVARALLDRFGLSDVPIKAIPGSLTDHYDPRDRSLSLSESVYGNNSIAAIGVAAHEVGHAMQHQEGYAPLRFRNAIVPVVNIGSMAAFPLFFIGLLFRGQVLMNVGIVMFIGVLVFHLVTLPVEIDASSRALRVLEGTGMLASDEIVGARKVLNAAAWTYVSATLMAAAQLIRLLILRDRFGGND